MHFGTRTRLAVAASVGTLAVLGPFTAVSYGQTHRVAAEPDPALCNAAKGAIADTQRLEAQVKEAEGNKSFFSWVKVGALKVMLSRSQALVATYDADLRKACGI